MQCDGKLLPTLDIYEENTDFLLILASSLDGENQLLFVCGGGGKTAIWTMPNTG